MNENRNYDLLSCMYENAQAGIYSINNVLPKAEDETLKNELETQLKCYQDFSKAAYSDLKDMHCAAHDISAMQKMMMKGKIAMETAMSNSASHIARMMIQGTNMGIISLNKELNRSDGAGHKYVSKAKDMLDAETAYLDRMKKYL